MSGLDAFFERLKGTGPWEIDEDGCLRCEGRCPLEVVADVSVGEALLIRDSDVGLSHAEFLDVMAAADGDLTPFNARVRQIRARLAALVPQPQEAA